MSIEEPREMANGLWSVGVHGMHPSTLVRALDLEVPFVVIEGHLPFRSGWHDVDIPLAAPDVAGVRRVRGLRYDLLMSPAEVLDAADELDRAGQGWLFAWQAIRMPPPDLLLDGKSGRARSAAVRGCGVTLILDLPHADESAVLTSPDRTRLLGAVGRLERHLATQRLA
ncbi:hypothetical protein ACFWGN_18690 [Oerskovia sp. NPDC060338]|uniref:hypothetical protein n=1 Tax=Oerskovia sp. NPDC060338 TaxID=3347100 RepID=UPI00365C7CB6